jgi:opacity protein-like surface antigen
MAAPAMAADTENPYENPYLKKQAITLRGGLSYAVPNDFTDFWPGKNDAREIAIGYERRVMERIGLGLAAGYSYVDEADKTTRTTTASTGDARVAYDLETPYLELTARYWSDPIADNRLAFYGGGGVGYYRPTLKMRYHDDVYTRTSEETHNVLGVHALAGVEFIVLKRPVHSGYADAPVGLFFEYRYSWAQIDSADEMVVLGLNNNGYGPYETHDLTMGGHSALMGLRWHFK